MLKRIIRHYSAWKDRRVRMKVLKYASRATSNTPLEYSVPCLYEFITGRPLEKR